MILGEIQQARDDVRIIARPYAVQQPKRALEPEGEPAGLIYHVPQDSQEVNARSHDHELRGIGSAGRRRFALELFHILPVDVRTTAVIQLLPRTWR